MSERVNLFARQKGVSGGDYTIFAGQRFAMLYQQRGTGGSFPDKRKLRLYGRIIELTPTYENDKPGGKVNGVKLFFKPGKFEKDAKGQYEWTEEQNPTEVELGPFDTITHVKSNAVIDEVPLAEEHNTEVFVLDDSTGATGTRQAQLTFMV